MNVCKLFLKAMISFRPFGLTSVLPYLQVKNKIIIIGGGIFLTHSDYMPSFVLKLLNNYEESLKVQHSLPEFISGWYALLFIVSNKHMYSKKKTDRNVDTNQIINGIFE